MKLKWRIVGGLLSVIVLGASWLILQPSQVPKTTPINTSLPTTAETQISIDRGTAYLRTNLAQIAPYQRLILDFLQRKFQLEPVFSAQTTPIMPPTDASAPQYAAVARIAYPNSLVSSLPAPTNTIDSMTASAANCDHIALPANYADLVAQNIHDGGYGLTHVVFALDFMQDNGCQLSARLTALKRQAIDGTVALAATARDHDLHDEAVAFALYNGQRARLQPAEIWQIVHEQRQDGGWGGAATDTSLMDHETVLALWALLEYAHANIPQTPLIRRPG